MSDLKKRARAAAAEQEERSARSRATRLKNQQGAARRDAARAIARVAGLDPEEVKGLRTVGSDDGRPGFRWKDDGVELEARPSARATRYSVFLVLEDATPKVDSLAQLGRLLDG